MSASGVEASAPIRVATYTRISTDEEHQPFSLQAQAERLGAYVISQGWTLGHRFTDQMTGSSLERPGLQQALAAGRAKAFDLLLVYRVDRLSRSVRGLAQILEELDKAGVGFRSATEPFDTSTPAGRMMVQMLGVFAEFERATLIDRVIAGMERKAAGGGWNGGTVPFGYQLDATSGSLAVNEAEAGLISVIFDLYLKQRLGSRSAARWLNAHGYRSRAGRAWSAMAVLTVLRSRTYLGEVRFRGKEHKGCHPALVGEDTFEAVQQLLSKRGESASKRATNSTDYLLAALITCGRCGRRYIGTAAFGRRQRYRYYTCLGRHREGRHACSAERIPADQLEGLVLKTLVDHLSGGQLLEAAFQKSLSAQGSDNARDGKEVEAITSEIHSCEAARARYLRAFETGALPEHICASRLAEIGQRLSDLRLRQLAITARISAASQRSPRLPPPAAQLFTSLARLRTPIVKSLVASLVAELEVSPEGAITLILFDGQGADREAAVAGLASGAERGPSANTL